MEIARDILQIEAVRRGERENEAVLGCCRLQLEVELPAEALAQRKPPRAIDPTAPRRVHAELHAARFVEEALEDDGGRRRQTAECSASRREIRHELQRSRFRYADLICEPAECRLRVTTKALLHFAAQP